MIGKKKKEEWLSDIREDIKILQKKFTQLECPHKDREFRIGWYYGMEVCCQCQKVIKTFRRKEDYNKAELQYMKEQVARREAELKAD